MVVFNLWRQGAVKLPHTGGVLESLVVDMGRKISALFERLSLLRMPTPVEYLKGQLKVSYGRVPVDVQ